MTGWATAPARLVAEWERIAYEHCRWPLLRTRRHEHATASTDVAVVPPDGSGHRLLTQSRDRRQGLSSSCSPSGQRIVYAARGVRERFHLIIMRSDGSGTRRLPRTELWDSAPRWAVG
jgi:Tol biopolymer transport system component